MLLAGAPARVSACKDSINSCRDADEQQAESPCDDSHCAESDAPPQQSDTPLPTRLATMMR